MTKSFWSIAMALVCVAQFSLQGCGTQGVFAERRSMWDDHQPSKKTVGDKDDKKTDDKKAAPADTSTVGGNSGTARTVGGDSKGSIENTERINIIRTNAPGSYNVISQKSYEKIAKLDTTTPPDSVAAAVHDVLDEVEDSNTPADPTPPNSTEGGDDRSSDRDIPEALNRLADNRETVENINKELYEEMKRVLLDASDRYVKTLLIGNSENAVTVGGNSLVRRKNAFGARIIRTNAPGAFNVLSSLPESSLPEDKDNEEEGEEQ